VLARKAHQHAAEVGATLLGLAPVTDAVRGCTDLMRFVRQTLIFEGLAPEQSIDCNGETYHIYRRPGDIAKAFQPLHTDRVLSRDHQFYFRVETNAGYHFDVVPLDGGDVAAAKPKAMPAGVKKHLLGLFATETLFDYDKAAMRSDPLSERLAEIDKTLVPLRVGNCSVIKEKAIIGDEVMIEDHTVVGSRVEIGEMSVIGNNVNIGMRNVIAPSSIIPSGEIIHPDPKWH